MKELLSIIGKLLVWWLTKREENKAVVIEAINKRAEGWKNESPTAIHNSHH